MILHKVRFKNFLATGNNFVTFTLDTDRIHLIVGKNGRGKSTIIDAICFALYNKPFRAINKPQLVNTINKKDCIVEIGFTAGNHKYLVRRGIKPSIFEVYKDKILISQTADNDDYQEILENEILRCSYKTFRQVNVLGSASYTPFMKLAAADRRQVVENLLDSQVFSTMNVLAKNELKQLYKQSSELSKQLAVVEAKIDTQTDLVNKRNLDNQQIIDQINQQISMLENDQQTIQKNVEQIIDRINQYNDQVANFPFDIQKTQQAVVDLNNQQYSLTKQKSSVEAHITTISQLTTCPTCRQLVDDNHKTAIITDANNQLNQFDQQLIKISNRLSVINRAIDQYNNVAKQINNSESEKSWLVRQFDDKIEQISQAKQRLSELSVKRQEIDDDQQILDQLLVDKHQLSDKYDQVHQQIEVLKQCINVYLADDGIKAQIVDKYIPIINQSINSYLEKMDTFIEFTLDQQFKETIRARYKDIFSYDSFSEGQKLRIDLAILFTWRYIAKLRNAVWSNVLIMDEILDRSMDDDGVEQFLQIVNQLSDADNTIIISPKIAVIDKFEKVTTVEFDGNFTQYN